MKQDFFRPNLFQAHFFRNAFFLSLIFFAFFALAQAQTVAPFVCTEPYSVSGTTTLTGNVAANASNFSVSSPIPTFATVVINPGGANEETRRVNGNFPGDPLRPLLHTASFTTQPNLSFAHSAGEPVSFVFDGVIGHFGYESTGGSTVNIPKGPTNFFLPGMPAYPAQTTDFLPGIHYRAFSLTIPPGTGEFEQITWHLGSNTARADNDPRKGCGMITYQGRLSQSGAAANGQYDLRFTLYDRETGGTAQSGMVTAANTPVSNGIFTVQLDFGLTFTGNFKAKYLEIGVRQTGSTGEFAVLTPRQPITNAPFAVNSVYAANAALLDGKGADQFLLNTTGQLSNAPQTANFNISGNGTIGSNLIVNGTITSGCRSGFTPIAGGRLCISEMKPAATFYGSGGATQTCITLGARVGTIADVTLSLTQSGFNYFNGVAQGWLADYAGDNLRPTWNSNASGDFDGAPVNVYNGNNGAAPVLPYRCVY